MKLFGINNVGFDIKINYLSDLLHSSDTGEKKTEVQWDSTSDIYRLKKAYDSVRKEALYNILIEFGIPMKLARLNKMCLNETCSKVRIDKHLFFIISLSRMV
jgi:hypothetical protein